MFLFSSCLWSRSRLKECAVVLRELNSGRTSSPRRLYLLLQLFSYLVIPDAPLNLFPQIGICFSLSLSLSARFSFVFKLKRNVGPFFVGQLVDLSVKREKIKKMDSPVGHRPCWYTDTGEEEERERERARPLRTDDGGAQRGRATPDHPFYTLKVSLDPSFSRLSSPPFSFLFCVTCACMNHRSSRGIYSAPRLDQSFRPRGSLQESLLHSPLFILFFSSSFHILFYFLPGA